MLLLVLLSPIVVLLFYNRQQELSPYPILLRTCNQALPCANMTLFLLWIETAVSVTQTGVHCPR